jgi:hypothetical protein
VHVVIGTVISTNVAGIPCKAECVHYFRQEPLGYRANSDWDARGYTECDFVILDRRGRLAEWLERKLTKDEADRIRADLIDAIKQNEREYA